jgi:S1-C subfamily serine protease/peptidoglycan hydrolase-like protein with peptidoglycan-binding domain
MARALCLLLLLILPLAARADHNSAPRGKVWVQAGIEADLRRSLRRAEEFSREFEFTRVFLLPDGSFALVLGVIDSRGARETMAELKRERRIPRESVTSDGAKYVTEFWTAKRHAATGDGLDPDIARAIAWEDGLGEAERRDLQAALIWTGDYVGLVDGDFGPMTRAAVRSFQAREGRLVTGFVDRGDADALVAARDRQMSAAGWQLVEDGPLGIAVGIPTRFFAGVAATDLGKQAEGAGEAGGALLSLLSLEGGRETLEQLREAALAEVARDRDRYETSDAASFTISGIAGGRVLYSYAVRTGDRVRGFLLSYDTGQRSLLDPVAIAMRSSFRQREIAAAPRLEDALAARPPRRETQPRPDPRPVPERTNPREATPRSPYAASGVAGRREDPSARRPPRETAPQTPRPDRRPPDPGPDAGEVDSTGTGFYVSLDGRILTNQHVVDGCRRMIVDGKDDAEVLATDEDNDLALLSLPQTREETAVAKFAPIAPRLNSDVTVVGYPLYGLLGGLNVTRGVVSALSGLRGNMTFIQISAEVQPGNSGGPALNEKGYVIGVVQSKLDALRLSRISGDIPQNINFAVRADVAQAFLIREGVKPLTGPADRADLPPADLAEEAQRFTVLLQCVK